MRSDQSPSNFEKAPELAFDQLINRSDTSTAGNSEIEDFSTIEDQYSLLKTNFSFIMISG